MLAFGKVILKLFFSDISFEDINWMKLDQDTTS
jgi:hypothetical protein